MQRLGKITLISELKKFSARLKEEKESRRNVKLLSFGVSYLDDALNGIREDDLVLIGARTGSGKTQLASTIALHNAGLGKNVFFFALEAADFEIERRIKYQILSKLYYDIQGKKGIWLNYMDWVDGKIQDQEILDAEKTIEDVWSKDFETLNIIYRENSSFTVEDLKRQMLAVHEKADLFIIDHLHFFDFDDLNENLAYKRIMKSISDISQKLKKPVVLIAQLRKSDRGARTIVPSEEDFHGTSDIVKMPSKIITMASATNVTRSAKMIEEHQWPTYVRIAKCRGDLSRGKYPALMLFSQPKSAYEKDYKVGQLSYDESEWTLTEKNNIPKWAKECDRYGLW